MQYLYLIKCQQFYKIGIANDVKSRLAQLATGNPFELQISAIYAFENASIVELSIHQAFSEQREKGEWFRLLEAEIDDFNLICNLLGGQPCSLLESAENEEIQEAEEIQEIAFDKNDEWDYDTMFTSGWRIEVTHGGKYWQWRERKRKGRVIYGGKFSELPKSRQDEYYQNKIS